MPRRRILDPGFWDDPQMGRLPLGARLTFEATWTLSDDAGLLEVDVRRIRLFAFRYDNFTDAQVGRWLEQLEDLGRLIPYESRGRRYYVVARFHKHQTINRPTPSQLPRPPKETLALLDDVGTKRVLARTEAPSSGAHAEAIKTAVGRSPLTEPHGKGSEAHSRSEVKGREEKGSEGKASEENARARADDHKTGDDGPPIPDDETELQRLTRLEGVVSDPVVRETLRRKRERMERAG